MNTEKGWITTKSGRSNPQHVDKKRKTFNSPFVASPQKQRKKIKTRDVPVKCEDDLVFSFISKSDVDTWKMNLPPLMKSFGDIYASDVLEKEEKIHEKILVLHRELESLKQSLQTPDLCLVCLNPIWDADQMIECNECASKICENCVLRHYADEKTHTYNPMDCVYSDSGFCNGYYPNPTKEV